MRERKHLSAIMRLLYSSSVGSVASSEGPVHAQNNTGLRDREDFALRVQALTPGMFFHGFKLRYCAPTQVSPFYIVIPIGEYF